MYEDDSGTRGAHAVGLHVATQETAWPGRELDAIESDLTRIVDMFLEATNRSDLAIGFLRCLGTTRGTLH